MKKIKHIFKVLFGTDENILFNTSFACLITATLFLILALITSNTNPKATDTFTYISSAYFAIWMILAQGADSAMNIVHETMRLFAFFVIFIFSLHTCLQFHLDNSSTSTFWVILSSIGLLLCMCYVVAKLTSIFNLIKKLFIQFKSKLFDSNKPAPTKVKALIENITAFLVSIGALTIAVKSITESIFQILDYFK